MMERKTTAGPSSQSTTSKGKSPGRVLVIAYGNPLRGDDGVAWRAADELERELSPQQVTILCRHQLAPELAEDLSRHDAVIFVDAASTESGAVPGAVKVEEIYATESRSSVSFSHHFSPVALVRMAAELYQAKTKAFSVSLTGKNFEHGEKLSAEVAAALPMLVAKLEKLIRELL